MKTERAIRRAVAVDEMRLIDEPVRSDMTEGALEIALLRLLRLDQRIHDLAGEAHGLGLIASWMRLEGVDDDIDAAIAGVRRRLHEVRS